MFLTFTQAANSLFEQKYNTSAVKGQYERSLKVYKFIVAFEDFTGGAGDGDEDAQDLKSQIEASRLGGCDVGNLSPAVLELWYKKGWYKLFNDRFGYFFCLLAILSEYFF